ncbi:MAG: hypothetical protein ACR2RL_12370, partial [Gammaproteobacteria bacterium]
RAYLVESGKITEIQQWIGRRSGRCLGHEPLTGTFVIPGRLCVLSRALLNAVCGEAVPKPRHGSKRRCKARQM